MAGKKDVNFQIFEKKSRNEILSKFRFTDYCRDLKCQGNQDEDYVHFF